MLPLPHNGRKSFLFHWSTWTLNYLHYLSGLWLKLHVEVGQWIRLQLRLTEITVKYIVRSHRLINTVENWSFTQGFKSQLLSRSTVRASDSVKLHFEFFFCIFLSLSIIPSFKFKQIKTGVKHTHLPTLISLCVLSIYRKMLSAILRNID